MAPFTLKRERTVDVQVSEPSRRESSKSKRSKLSRALVRPIAYNRVGVLDAQAISTAADSSGAVTYLTGPATTTAGTESVRNGPAIYWERARVHLNIQNGATSITTGVTVMLVYDKQPRLAAASSTDIVDLNSGFPTMNASYTDRFVVLKRSTIQLVGAGSATAGLASANEPRQAAQIIWDIKLKKKAIYLATSSTGVVANCSMGSLYLLCVGSSATAASVTGIVKLTFSDA